MQCWMNWCNWKLLFYFHLCVSVCVCVLAELMFNGKLLFFFFFFVFSIFDVANVDDVQQRAPI